jgi:hypothetical protein
MIFKILPPSGEQAFTVSMKKTRVPLASVPPARPALAAPGMLVTYGDGHLGRVLGRIEAPAELRGWLLVLQLSSTADFAYLRWIEPASVRECRRNPSRFARWFFQPHLPTPDLVAHLADQARLSEAWIDPPALPRGAAPAKRRPAN